MRLVAPDLSRGRPASTPCPESRRLGAGLALALLALAAQPAAAEGFLGIPLERQPFVKVCPDGSIVGSLGATLPDADRRTFGAFAYDGRKGRTEFFQRGPDFEARLSTNPCVRQPVGRRAGG